MNRIVDVAANRSARKWTRKELVGRALWSLVFPLFRLSPRIFWGWRRFILRAFGARVGKDVHIFPTTRIAIPWNLTLGDGCALGDRTNLYSLGHIRVGCRATISQGAHLCAGTHDWRDPAMPLLKRPIAIGDDVWVCADAFLGPGVHVGARVIVGARAVVMKDVAADLIVAGNPAQIVGTRTS
jgi:putative colanic acid biosynthesis acetyltransferase WcaF